VAVEVSGQNSKIGAIASLFCTRFVPKKMAIVTLPEPLLPPMAPVNKLTPSWLAAIERGINTRMFANREIFPLDVSRQESD
jgi:hypothetical protein